jgi:hypothetical protein
MEKRNTIMEKGWCTHDVPVIVTTSLLVIIVTTFCTNQPTMIDDAPTKTTSSYTYSYYEYPVSLNL